MAGIYLFKNPDLEILEQAEGRPDYKKIRRSYFALRIILLGYVYAMVVLLISCMYLGEKATSGWSTGILMGENVRYARSSIGKNPHYEYEPLADWGLDPDDYEHETRFYVYFDGHGAIRGIEPGEGSVFKQPGGTWILAGIILASGFIPVLWILAFTLRYTVGRRWNEFLAEREPRKKKKAKHR